MKLHEEFKLYEEMWEPNSLKEDIDHIAALKATEKASIGWYTEYFAVGPAVCENATDEVFIPENFDGGWEEFEEHMNDIDQYSILPIVFGPHLHRTYEKEQHENLEAALDNVINNLYSDSDLKTEIKTYADLFDAALVDTSTTDNSVTFVVAYAPDVQDSYGCYMRVSQKPLNSNQNLAKYYAKKPSAAAPNVLAYLLDNGLISDDFSSASNFDSVNYAWQAK